MSVSTPTGPQVCSPTGRGTRKGLGQEIRATLPGHPPPWSLTSAHRWHSEPLLLSLHTQEQACYIPSHARPCCLSSYRQLLGKNSPEENSHCLLRWFRPNATAGGRKDSRNGKKAWIRAGQRRKESILESISLRIRTLEAHSERERGRLSSLAPRASPAAKLSGSVPEGSHTQTHKRTHVSSLAKLSQLGLGAGSRSPKCGQVPPQQKSMLSSAERLFLFQEEQPWAWWSLAALTSGTQPWRGRAWL